MKELMCEFKQWYRIRGRAESTIEETARKLQTFIDYLAACNIEHIDGITKDVIKAYQVEQYQAVNRYGKPNSITYQNLLLSAVKQFTRFLKLHSYIVADPAVDVPYAKEPQKLPRSVLTVGEVRKLMRVPDTKTLIGYRDRTILEVLYSTGIRRAELHNLTVEDVDYDDGFLRVTGKGNKDRIVPLGAIACRYLKNFLTSVRPEFVKPHSPNTVFLSQRGNRLSNRVMIKFIKDYAKKAGIKKNVHPHTFRHTCATVMLKNKANIRVVQELLGHKALTSTQIYTRITITDLKDVHKRCHPREKDAE